MKKIYEAPILIIEEMIPDTGIMSTPINYSQATACYEVIDGHNRLLYVVNAVAACEP